MAFSSLAPIRALYAPNQPAGVSLRSLFFQPISRSVGCIMRPLLSLGYKNTMTVYLGLALPDHQEVVPQCLQYLSSQAVLSLWGHLSLISRKSPIVLTVSLASINLSFLHLALNPENSSFQPMCTDHDINDAFLIGRIGWW